MARIDEIIAGKSAPVFSFEFFPPKSDEGEANLRRALRELAPLAPDFVSVTYGAGGTTRDRTVDIVASLRQEFGLEAMAHFTCVNATVDDLRATLSRMRDAGVENVLALRGDPPEGQDRWTQTEGGLEYSSELVALLESEFEFSIGAACFPETHVDAVDADSDLRHLKEKVEAGARFLVTQLFFENAYYFDFVARAREAGIDVPIIPGIMPITNVAQIKRITALCGSEIPDRLRYALESRADEPEAVAELGVAYATLQCAELLAEGAPGVHFYTLNRSPSTRAILGALRLMRPWQRAVTPV
ncbi:MAG: methylenetetrahydrofolate reductase [Solirubrobacteraceae bacterium]|nr:methylenetetrahydrofolate reductase [Solirubrobacteraceae bacterium]